MSLQPPARITSPPPEKPTSQYDWEPYVKRSRESATLCANAWEGFRYYARDRIWNVLGRMSLTRRIKQRAYSSCNDGGQGGRGLAVLLTGSGDPTAIKIALDLAKRGYTVFALIPIYTTASTTPCNSLSSLVYAWSRTHRRLREKWPDHPGMVVPVLIDPPLHPIVALFGPKSLDDLIQAGNTIRVYCHDHQLALVAVLAVFSDLTADEQMAGSQPPSPPPRYISLGNRTYSVPRTNNSISYEDPWLVRTEGHGFFNHCYEDKFYSLGDSNVLVPRHMIRILKDLLVRSTELGHGTSRVISLHGELGLGVVDTRGAMRTLGVGKRREAITWAMRAMHDFHKSSLRTIKADELDPSGIAFSEIIAGPVSQSQRRGVLGHSRHASDESTESDRSRRSAFARVFSSSSPGTPPGRHPDDEDVMEARLARRFAEVAKGWSVDETLLFSTIARAIEDRYPLKRYHVGLSPILLDLSVHFPLFWLFQMIVQWLLRMAIVVSFYRARGDGLGMHVNRFLGL